MTISSTPILDDAAVRVAVRARPLLEKEVLDNCQECVSYSAERSEVSVGKEKRFTFDHVFGPLAGQEEVYLACVKPLVDSCIAGYNATVLAYGQTGSGKTHTMGSANGNGLQEHELGILPRVIRQLYKSIEENNQSEFLVKCSFVEIHNEEIKDLLHPETPSKSIFIREDANGDIILAGVREEVVTSFEDMMKCLEHGSIFRTTGSTLMNQHSSRSHAIFTIIVEQRSCEDSTDIDIITAKFHLVDLAGSERAKRTGAVGVRFKESITINSGLLALGNVISALGDERKRGQHVPYRQSKLTRILQNLQEELISMRLREKDDACALDCYRSRGDPLIDGTARVQDGASHMPQDVLGLTHNLRDFKLTIDKLNEQLAALQVEKDHYQEQINDISSEMNLLLRMIPSWELTKEIAEPPILFLLAMAKRIMAGTREGGMDFKACNLQTDIGIQILRDTQQNSESTNFSAFISKESHMNSDDILTDPGKENAFAGTRPLSTDTPRIIRQYLKTIQVLEKKLAKKEQELGDKNEALKEMNIDLARDENIFAEKMKEIKALKMLTRELTIEKDCLLQKAQMDATIISDLSHNALAKEGELSRLRASIEFQKMQPQDTAMTVNPNSFSDFNKKGQVGAMCTQGAESHSREDSFTCNKAMEEMVQAERETWEARAMCAVRKQEQLERDHQALKEELENTRSLMQKAGLGIRLSAQNVRELSNGDVDLRTSISC